MAQQFLDGQEIGAVFVQVRRERVAHRMRRRGRVDAADGDERAKDLVEHRIAQPAAVAAEEEGPSGYRGGVRYIRIASAAASVSSTVRSLLPLPPMTRICRRSRSTSSRSRPISSRAANPTAARAPRGAARSRSRKASLRPATDVARSLSTSATLSALRGSEHPNLRRRHLERGGCLHGAPSFSGSDRRSVAPRACGGSISANTNASRRGVRRRRSPRGRSRLRADTAPRGVGRVAAVGLRQQERAEALEIPLVSHRGRDAGIACAQIIGERPDQRIGE